MAFFITLGAILILLGALVCHSYRIKFASYRGFPAEVLGFRSEFQQAGDDEKELLCAVVDYQNGTETIRANHEQFLPAEEMPCQRGDKLVVQVNADFPDRFLFTNEVKGTSAFGVAMVIGGALTVAFHLIWKLLY
ncbi:MAG: hypothetical protein K6B38_11955 [Ruminococcus sp.]|nr:hypothetical protein [Ruminococcus sp.]